MHTELETLINNEPARIGEEDLKHILLVCSEIGVSDITLQSEEPIIADLYGVLNKITKRSLSTPEIGSLINALYGPNATTQIASGVDIDTDYEFTKEKGKKYRFRMNVTGCMVDGHDGIQITIRTIPITPPPLDFHKLPKNLIDALAPQDGVIYVTGSTGSGKSTLLASIIRNIVEQESSHRKVLTYESPIEYVFDEISKPTSIVCQSEIPRHLPSFAAGVRNALRRKPRLILVGESRDTETINAVMDAALTGHPVYTTLHTNGVSESIRRLVGAFPIEERYGKIVDIIETTRVIIWQKLVPKVGGGLVALREFLVFDSIVRDKLLETNPDQVTSETRKLLYQYGQPIIVDADEKLKNGVITEREHKLIAYEARRQDNS